MISRMNSQNERDTLAVAESRLRVESALDALRAGRPIIVVDDVGRENEGDIFIPCGAVDSEQMAFLLRHSTGIVCVALNEERCAELGLGLMVDAEGNGEALGTAFTVTVDARDGVTTGVSASDRVVTARLLAGATTVPNDLVRPGHVFPLRARPGGVLERRGHTEAGVDLALAAGLPPAMVLSELMNLDGTMMRTPDIRRFSEQHALTVISVDDVVRYRQAATSCRSEPDGRLAEVPPITTIPTRLGTLAVSTFPGHGGVEHVAIIIGDLAATTEPLVRVHSECFTGDLLGSLRCDCGDQLRVSIAYMREEGAGILIYMRGHEGRGIGFAAKLLAYNLQEDGFDTVDANTALGHPVDSRRYDDAAVFLRSLGKRRIRLLTNNPSKVEALNGSDIEVASTIPLEVTVNPHNAGYLATKRDRMGHKLSNLDSVEEHRVEICASTAS